MSQKSLSRPWTTEAIASVDMMSLLLSICQEPLLCKAALPAQQRTSFTNVTCCMQEEWAHTPSRHLADLQPGAPDPATLSS